MRIQPDFSIGRMHLQSPSAVLSQRRITNEARYGVISINHGQNMTDVKTKKANRFRFAFPINVFAVQRMVAATWGRP